MPPRTRRPPAPEVQYVVMGEEEGDVLVSKHLANRLFDAELEGPVDKTCAICLDECCCRHCASYTKCGHGPFHLACISVLPRCPICRSEA